MAGLSKGNTSDLELNDIDRISGTWKKLEQHLAARLDLLRRQNDTDLDPAQTADLRGRIAEIKNLLAAGATQD